MTERRVVILNRAPLRNLADDVLTMHTVLGAALVGRATEAHLKRAVERAHESARGEIFGRICPVCARDLAHEVAARVWITYKGRAYEVRADNPLGLARAYCSRHCATAQLLRAGLPFVVGREPLDDPDATQRLARG